MAPDKIYQNITGKTCYTVGYNIRQSDEWLQMNTTMTIPPGICIVSSHGYDETLLYHKTNKTIP